MKRLLKYFLAALVVITGVFSQTADAKAFSYTYTVSFSAGGQGSINGGVQVRKASGNEASVSVSAKGDKIIVTGLEYGDVISCDAQGSVALNENSKYYVKGIRLSGRDNNTVAQSAFLVSGDQDYVVAYGIPGELAEYTVNYVDTDGNKLAESRTYYGNVGDEPVIAYLYIDGYIPDSYNQTGKLSSNASENVFNLYIQGLHQAWLLPEMEQMTILRQAAIRQPQELQIQPGQLMQRAMQQERQITELQMEQMPQTQ